MRRGALCVPGVRIIRMKRKCSGVVPASASWMRNKSPNSAPASESSVPGPLSVTAAAPASQRIANELEPAKVPTTVLRNAKALACQCNLALHTGRKQSSATVGGLQATPSQRQWPACLHSTLQCCHWQWQWELLPVPMATSAKTLAARRRQRLPIK